MYAERGKCAFVAASEPREGGWRNAGLPARTQFRVSGCGNLFRIQLQVENPFLASQAGKPSCQSCKCTAETLAPGGRSMGLLPKICAAVKVAGDGTGICHCAAFWQWPWDQPSLTQPLWSSATRVFAAVCRSARGLAGERLLFLVLPFLVSGRCHVVPAPDGYHPLSMGEVQVCVCLSGCRGLRWHVHPWVVWLLKGGVQAGLVACEGGEEPETPLSPKASGWSLPRISWHWRSPVYTQPLGTLVTEWQVYFEKTPPSSPSIQSCFSSECLIAIYFFLVRLYRWTFIDRNQIVIWAKRPAPPPAPPRCGSQEWDRQPHYSWACAVLT